MNGGVNDYSIGDADELSRCGLSLVELSPPAVREQRVRHTVSCLYLVLF